MSKGLTENIAMIICEANYNDDPRGTKSAKRIKELF